PGKLEAIDHRRCRHKPRMIVFLRWPVKRNAPKTSNQAGTYSNPWPLSRVLVLASSSPYRRALLERLRVPFAVANPRVDESRLAGETPRATALRLAESKARAVAVAHPSALIVGSDQIAVLDGAPLGKPGSHAAALAQLRAMCGRAVVFHTALCLLDASRGACAVEDVPTTVYFRNYSDAQAS